MKNSSHTIYMLVDPRDHKPFYIGQTKYLKRRYKDHCNPLPSDRTTRAKRLREILKSGEKPSLVVIEETPSELIALIKEMYWISTFLNATGIELKNREAQKWLYERYADVMTQIHAIYRPKRRYKPKPAPSA